MTGQRTPNRATSHVPIRAMVATGAATGLLWSLAVVGDAPLALIAGAAIGLLVGLATEAVSHS